MPSKLQPFRVTPTLPLVMKIAIIGAAPTGLGAAYRLNELISRGRLSKDDVDVAVFEQVSCNSP